MAWLIFRLCGGECLIVWDVGSEPFSASTSNSSRSRDSRMTDVLLFTPVVGVVLVAVAVDVAALLGMTLNHRNHLRSVGKRVKPTIPTGYRKFWARWASLTRCFSMAAQTFQYELAGSLRGLAPSAQRMQFLRGQMDPRRNPRSGRIIAVRSDRP